MERRSADDESQSTPAPKEDQIEGSEKNSPGSAKNASGGIEVSDPVRKSLQAKVISHNAEMRKAGRPKWTKASLGQLLAVYRRGAGAYSTSHRPNVSRAAWAMARVNAYLFLLRSGHPRDAKYVTDNDLLPSGHPRKSEPREDTPPLLEFRARIGRAGKKKRPRMGSPRAPAKMGAFAGCGTGAGGFKPGNRCGKEDGIPNKPVYLGRKGFAQVGEKPIKIDRAKLKEQIAAGKAKAEAKRKARMAEDKKKSIQIKRQKAAVRKAAKDKAESEAAIAQEAAKKSDRKAKLIAIKRKKAAERKKEKQVAEWAAERLAAEAKARKRDAMLRLIREKKAAEAAAAKKASATAKRPGESEVDAILRANRPAFNRLHKELDAVELRHAPRIESLEKTKRTIEEGIDFSEETIREYEDILRKKSKTLDADSIRRYEEGIASFRQGIEDRKVEMKRVIDWLYRQRVEQNKEMHDIISEFVAKEGGGLSTADPRKAIAFEVKKSDRKETFRANVGTAYRFFNSVLAPAHQASIAGVRVSLQKGANNYFDASTKTAHHGSRNDENTTPGVIVHGVAQGLYAGDGSAASARARAAIKDDYDTRVAEFLDSQRYNGALPKWLQSKVPYSTKRREYVGYRIRGGTGKSALGYCSEYCDFESTSGNLGPVDVVATGIQRIAENARKTRKDHRRHFDLTVAFMAGMLHR